MKTPTLLSISVVGKSLALASAVLCLLPWSASAAPRRVTEQEGLRSALQKVTPVYPAMAKQLKLSGRVVVDMTVSENGSVEDAEVVNGNPILAAAAKNAARGWRFQPFQEDGKETKAVVRVNFDFSN